MKGAALLLLFFINSTFVNAQNTVHTDSVKVAFLPALAYNSDMGFIGGGIVSRYKYAANTKPFYSFLNMNVLVSTKGLVSAQVFYDKPFVFGSQQRLTSQLYVSRFLQNQYYGIGNYTLLPDSPPGKPDYYLYKSFSTGFEFVLRRPLISASSNSHLDMYGLINFDYRTPWGNDTNHLIMQEMPEGIHGGITSALGTGLIWDNRDNEFAPTKGNYAKAGFQIGNEVLGSSYNYFIFESETKAYLTFHLIKNITFANRLSFNHTSGKLPYWKLAELGGEETMRGYPENRFLDNNALFLNSELRTWLFEFPEYQVRFGGTLFMDIGRTLPNGASLNNVFNDLKYTFGFGGNSSFFTNEFILRADMGFSDEGYGIYFTAGYMF